MIDLFARSEVDQHQKAYKRQKSSRCNFIRKPRLASLQDKPSHWLQEIPLLPYWCNFNKPFCFNLSQFTSLTEITAIPTNFESTSLVFAYGHDLFFTKVAPDNPYDILDDDFNYIALILSVLIATAAALALRFYAKKTRIEKFFFIWFWW